MCCQCVANVLPMCCQCVAQLLLMWVRFDLEVTNEEEDTCTTHTHRRTVRMVVTTAERGGSETSAFSVDLGVYLMCC
jgi:hypothetical protein